MPDAHFIQTVRMIFPLLSMLAVGNTGPMSWQGKATKRMELKAADAAFVELKLIWSHCTVNYVHPCFVVCWRSLWLPMVCVNFMPVQTQKQGRGLKWISAGQGAEGGASVLAQLKAKARKHKAAISKSASFMMLWVLKSCHLSGWFAVQRQAKRQTQMDLQKSPRSSRDNVRKSEIWSNHDSNRSLQSLSWSYACFFFCSGAISLSYYSWQSIIICIAQFQIRVSGWWSGSLHVDMTRHAKQWYIRSRSQRNIHFAAGGCQRKGHWQV